MATFKVDSKLIKELRATTNLPIIDCKEALIESKNNLEEAHKILRIKGLAKAEKKSVNSVKEGITKVLISGNDAVIAELNCQSEQVANLTEFDNLLTNILQLILKHKPSSLAAVLQLTNSDSGETVSDELKLAIAKLGENIVLARFKYLSKKNDETFGSYIHAGGKYASLVVTSGGKVANEVAYEIAKQVVANNPRFIDLAHIPTTVREEELALVKAKTLAEEATKEKKRPANILENIINGRINKLLSELTLVDQDYIKDPSIKIKDYLSQNDVKIIAMVRYQLGEAVGSETK